GGGVGGPNPGGGWRVDNKLDVTRRRRRQMGCLSALREAVDTGPPPPHQVDWINAVRQQAAFDSLVTVRVNCRHRVPSGQKNNQLTMHRVEGIRHYDQAAIGLACQRGYRVLDLVGIRDAGYDRLDRERAGDRLER